MLSAPVLFSHPSLSDGRGKKPHCCPGNIQVLIGPEHLGKAGLQEQKHSNGILFTCPHSEAKKPKSVPQKVSQVQNKSLTSICCDSLSHPEMKPAKDRWPAAERSPSECLSRISGSQVRAVREKPQESVSSSGSSWSLQKQTWIPEHLGIKGTSEARALRVCT